MPRSRAVFPAGRLDLLPSQAKLNWVAWNPTGIVTETGTSAGQLETKVIYLVYSALAQFERQIPIKQSALQEAEFLNIMRSSQGKLLEGELKLTFSHTAKL